MPTCQNCHRKWTWKQTFKRSFILDGGMKCPHCSEMQYYTPRFRKTTTIIHLIILTLLFTISIIWGPSIFFVAAIIGFVPLFIVIYPFFVELSNEEESRLQ